MNESSSDALLSVQDLVVRYRNGRSGKPFYAVDGASLEIEDGETVGLVGESGSGKTTIGRAILGLAPVYSGSIHFQDIDTTHLSFRDRRPFTKDLQVVFQDPYGSFNPSRTIGKTLIEPLSVHEDISRFDALHRAEEMLVRVGLPRDSVNRYPGEFSGGQRQRIAIARALMVSPRLVICDEPCSALDLSVQAQILNLLSDLQSELRVSYLFISHDLAVVRYLAKRLIVLNKGKVVETGSVDDVYTAPAHPYTRALLSAMLTIGSTDDVRRPVTRSGRTITTNVQIGIGCHYVAMCPFATEMCHIEEPILREIGAKRTVACHHAEEVLRADVTFSGSSS